MMQQQSRVALVTIRSPEDRGSWSGTQHRIYHQLQQDFDVVEPLGPIKLSVFERAVLRAFERLCGLVLRKYSKIHSLLRGYIYARRFSQKIRKGDYTLVFASACCPVAAFLKADLPIVYLSDATFELLVDYYEEFSGLSKLSLFEGEFGEKHAINNADVVIFSSEWARQSAIEHYGADPDKVHVCLFGANIDAIPAHGDRSTKLAWVGEQCNLLFLARDWRRKGGQVALDAFHELKTQGLNVTLTICGCEPDQSQRVDGLTVIPFLDKGLEVDRNRYHRLMCNAHFLLLPTSADCTPMVVAEANAYGMPVITSETGGIPSLVENGKNGYLLPLTASGKEYARLVKETFFEETDQYLNLVNTSFSRYEQLLNWDAWGSCVKQSIDDRLLALSQSVP